MLFLFCDAWGFSVVVKPHCIWPAYIFIVSLLKWSYSYSYTRTVFLTMQASTVEKTTLARPHLSTVKAKQQKEAIKPRIFSFTVEDLYNYLHQKTGNVETINIEECKNKKLEENGTGMDKPSSCRLMLFCPDMIVCLNYYLQLVCFLRGQRQFQMKTILLT